MENCENLKKMSFKGLEKRPRIFSPYVAILRYLDLACLPLYIIRIPVNWNKCFFSFHKPLKSLVPNPDMCKMRQKIIASMP